MKKLAIILSLGAFLIAPVLTFADHNDLHTIQQLQDQIQALQAQMTKLQGQSGVTTPSRTPPFPPLSPTPTLVGLDRPQNIPSFNRDLFFGMKGDSDVFDLQELLTDQGYYAGPITGNFGLLTLSAVKKFQSDHNIKPTGYFGPSSRTIANEIIQKLVGQICPREEGCGGNVFPPAKIYMTADSDLAGIVGDYLKLGFKAFGGSGNYTIEVDGGVPGLSRSDANYPPDTVILAGVPVKSGVFTVTFVVKDSASSAYGKDQFTIVIKDKVVVSRPPVIHGVKGPTELKIGEEGIWEVRASDPFKGNLSYRVIWGDEAYSKAAGEAAPQAVPFKQTSTFSHTYYAAGVHTPMFYVVNDKGLEAKTSISVNVASQPTALEPTLKILDANGTLQNTITLRIRDRAGQTMALNPLSFPSLPLGEYSFVVKALSPSNRVEETVTGRLEVVKNGYQVGNLFFNGKASDDKLVITRSGNSAKITVSQPNSRGESVLLTLYQDNRQIPISVGDALGPFYKLDVGVYTLLVAALDGAGDSKLKLVVNERGYVLQEQKEPIVQPSVQVLSPNGGEVWKIGEQRLIQWKAPAQGGKLQLVSGRGDGISVWTIGASPTNSFLWTVGKVADLQSPLPGIYYVQVIQNGTSDTSDAPFSIVAGSVPPKSVTAWTDKLSYTAGETLKFFAKVTDPDGTPFTPQEGAKVYGVFILPSGEVTGSGKAEHELYYNTASGYYERSYPSDTSAGLGTAGAAPGTYVFYAEVWQAGTKNILATSGRSNFTIASTLPDLVIGDITYSRSPSPAFAGTDLITFKVTISNPSSINVTTPFAVAISVKPDSQYPTGFRASNGVSSLNAGAKTIVIINGSYIIPSGKVFSNAVTASVDNANAVKESNEGNNSITRDIIVAAQAPSSSSFASALSAIQAELDDIAKKIKSLAR